MGKHIVLHLASRVERILYVNVIQKGLVWKLDNYES